jgi:hypothetical protein
MCAYGGRESHAIPDRSKVNTVLSIEQGIRPSVGWTSDNVGTWFPESNIQGIVGFRLSRWITSDGREMHATVGRSSDRSIKRSNASSIGGGLVRYFKVRLDNGDNGRRRHGETNMGAAMRIRGTIVG